MSEIELTRAMALHQAGQLAEAEGAYRAILSVDPNDADAASYLGVLLHQLRRHDESVLMLQQSVALRPDDAAIRSNLGMALAGANRMAEAEQCLRAALQFQPELLPALLNLGQTLRARDALREAVEIFDAARRKHPDCTEAWLGLADVYQALHDSGPAVAAYRRAISISNPPSARVGVASTLLLMGELAQGWPSYEARWELSGRSSSAGFDKPRWDGSDLHGKTILLHAEQGLGDTIQFIRYVPMVRARGGKVVVLAPPQLVNLLAGQLAIERVVSEHAAVGEFDVQCPLLSLPGVFGTTLQTIPSQTPYLKVDADKTAGWRSQLPTGKPRVGIVWAGSTHHANDAKRSIAFSQIQSLLHEVDAMWISLQIERGESDPILLDWTSELRDLTDTAALMSNLDFVVSVDTAVAHLAGALGKPTGLLIPYAPDWRWMWNREDSPWYPTMRLFRQETPGDWSAPIQRIAAELHQLRHISR